MPTCIPQRVRVRVRGAPCARASKAIDDRWLRTSKWFGMTEEAGTPGTREQKNAWILYFL